MERNIRVVAKGHPTSGDGGTHNLLRIAVSWRWSSDVMFSGPPRSTVPFARMKSVDDKMLDAPTFQQHLSFQTARSNGNQPAPAQ